jgi:hypothetical protein
MATSGSIDYELTRDNIITEALELLGVLPEGVSPTSAQLTSCARTLNSMLKAWQTRGTHLFVNQRLYLFLQKADREYTAHLTASSSDELTASFYATTVNGAVAATSTALVVDDGTNITDSDRIGILAADGSMHWTTVASGGGTVNITLTAGDADNALPDGSVVYSYTTKASRFRKINHASWRESPTNDWGFHDSLDGAEIDIDVLARTDYASLSDKSAGGRVNQIYYDKTWPAATIRTWPEPDKGGRYLVLWVERPIEDMDAASDNFDMPQEWSLAIGCNLAMWLAPKFGVADKTWGRIVALAKESLFDAEGGDTEGGMFMQPDMERG